MPLELNINIRMVGPIDVRHHVEPGDTATRTVLDQIQKSLFKLEKSMSQIGDQLNAAIDKVGASTDAALARVATDVDKLNATIADLTAKLAAGGLSADEAQAIQAKLEGVQAKLDALDPTSEVTLPAP